VGPFLFGEANNSKRYLSQNPASVRVSMQRNNNSNRPIRRLAYFTSMVAAFLPVFISCSAEAPQNEPEQVVTPDAASNQSTQRTPANRAVFLV